MAEPFRTLVLGLGSGQRVGLECVPCPAPRLSLMGGGKREGVFILASRAQVGMVRILRSADTCDEVISGHPLQLLRALGLGMAGLLEKAPGTRRVAPE